MSNSFLLSPGIKLMGHLSFRNKFTVLAILFIIPIAWLMTIYITDSLHTINFSEKERDGVSYLKVIHPVTKNIAVVRDLTKTYLYGDTTVKGKIENAVSKVERSFSQLASVEKDLRNNFVPDIQVSSLHRQWTVLQRDALSQSAETSFAAYNHFIESLHDYTLHIADVSHLILDSHLETYYLIDSLVIELPAMLDRLGRARGLGAAIAVNKSINTNELAALVGYADEIKLFGDKWRHGFDKVYAAAPALKEPLAKVDSAFDKHRHRYVQVINDELIQTKNIELNANLFFSQGSEVIDDGINVYEATLPVLDRLLEKRIHDEQAVMYKTIILISAVSILVAYLFVAFSKSVINSINNINATVGELSRGNFRVSAKVISTDEVGSVAGNLNTMITKISALILQVVSATSQVASAAEQASTTAAQAQKGINQQNSEIEQVATAINEMSATVHEVAQNTANAAELTQTADAEANSGRTIVTQAINSINLLADKMDSSSTVIQNLESQSESIGTVLDVIRGIAEQTNLLALNAAIEAARAGEQGRGFAVVADEVRTLASRTQESTEEINDMIVKLQAGARNAVEAMTQGSKQTNQSVEQAIQAGEALDQISTAVSTIHDMNMQIASAAEEQSSVSEEINRNIVNIRDIAEETVKGANQTAQSSAEMTKVASDLIRLVSEFKV